MSILIKGVEMPTSCLDCPFMVSHDNDDCILQSDEANKGFESWEQMKDSCPLVPVPLHGDLIDRDALMQHEVLLPMDGGHLPIVYASYVRNASAIVSAEKKDKLEAL